ncbi:hypothetical protein, partial [Pseudomonas indica]
TFILLIHHGLVGSASSRVDSHDSSPMVKIMTSRLMSVIEWRTRSISSTLSEEICCENQGQKKQKATCHYLKKKGMRSSIKEYSENQHC